MAVRNNKQNIVSNGQRSNIGAGAKLGSIAGHKVDVMGVVLLWLAGGASDRRTPKM